MPPGQLPSCDTVVVLAPHTRRGVTMLAKNSDRPPLECQPLFHAPRRRHHSGSVVHCQYLEIPQVAETAAIVGSRPHWLWGFEHGVNEYGVAIGNEAVLTRESLPSTGLLGMDLVRLGLERGKSAREATETIGALIEQYGQGGSAAHEFDFRYSGGFIIADPHEAYVLESSARQWAARKVEDRACISNRLTIGSDGDLASADAPTCARERGWWDGQPPFNFAEAYSDTNADPLSACARLARTRELIARRGKRTIREMTAMMRDHYERGEMPVITALPGTDQSFSVCMHSLQGTTASMLAELPDAESGEPAVMWACLAAPCTGIYFPVYPCAQIPPVLASGGARPSTHSPWWQMKRIQDLIARDPERLAPVVWKHFRALENAMIEHAAELALKLKSRKPADRPRILTTFVTQNVTRVLREASKVESELSQASGGIDSHPRHS